MVSKRVKSISELSYSFFTVALAKVQHEYFLVEDCCTNVSGVGLFSEIIEAVYCMFLYLKKKKSLSEHQNNKEPKLDRIR